MENSISNAVMQAKATVNKIKCMTTIMTSAVFAFNENRFGCGIS